MPAQANRTKLGPFWTRLAHARCSVLEPLSALWRPAVPVRLAGTVPRVIAVVAHAKTERRRPFVTGQAFALPNSRPCQSGLDFMPSGAGGVGKRPSSSALERTAKRVLSSNSQEPRSVRERQASLRDGRNARPNSSAPGLGRAYPQLKGRAVMPACLDAPPLAFDHARWRGAKQVRTVLTHRLATLEHGNWRSLSSRIRASTKSASALIQTPLSTFPFNGLSLMTSGFSHMGQ